MKKNFTSAARKRCSRWLLVSKGDLAQWGQDFHLVQSEQD